MQFPVAKNIYHQFYNYIDIAYNKLLFFDKNTVIFTKPLSILGNLMLHRIVKIHFLSKLPI